MATYDGEQTGFRVEKHVTENVERKLLLGDKVLGVIRGRGNWEEELDQIDIPLLERAISTQKEEVASATVRRSTNRTFAATMAGIVVNVAGIMRGIDTVDHVLFVTPTSAVVGLGVYSLVGRFGRPTQESIEQGQIIVDELVALRQEQPEAAVTSQ